MNKKLSIYTSLNKGSFEERMRAIKNAGFDAVCLDFEEQVIASDGEWESQLLVAEKYSLPVETVHLTGSGMSDVWAENENGDFVAKRLKDEIKRLKSLGLSSGVCHVTWGLERPFPPGEIGYRRFSEIAEMSEKYGVKLALENSVFPEYLEFIFGKINSPCIGFCYDSGHENCFSPDFDYISRFGDRLFALHLHDNPGDFDSHEVPFSGTINWDEKVGKLKTTGLWNELVTLESCVRSGQSLEEGLSEAYESALKLAVM